MLLGIRRLNHELEEDMLDMKCRSMSDNLVFLNFREHEDEDTENVLKSFLKTDSILQTHVMKKCTSLVAKSSGQYWDRLLGHKLLWQNSRISKIEKERVHIMEYMNSSQRR